MKQILKTKLTDTENRLVVVRGEELGGVAEMDEGSQRVQTSSYKLSNRDIVYNTTTIVNNIILYI